MRDKIEVWPKMVWPVFCIAAAYFAIKNDIASLNALILLVLVGIQYILLINDERVYDIHQRLRYLEILEEREQQNKWQTFDSESEAKK